MAVGGKGPTVIWSMFMVWCVTAIFLCLRVYTRLFIVKSMGWDDSLLLIGLLFLLLFAVFAAVAAEHGLGQHMANLSMEELVEALKWTSIAQSVGIFGSGIFKVSLGVFLLRLVVSRWHKICLVIPASIVMILSILTSVGIWVQYTPSRAVYDPRLPKVTHFNQTNLSLVDASFLIMSDFFYAAFPWVFIWNLKRSRKERITIAAGLSLGIFAGACGITRTVQLVNLDSKDFTFDLCDAIIWTSAEMATTAICNTIPTLFPLYRKIRRQNTDDSQGYSHQLPRSNSQDHADSYPMDFTGRKGAHHTKVITADNESDERILGESYGGIQHTQEYTVKYSS